MDIVSKSILIIGIDSFTGKHLSKYLEKYGFNIFGTSLKEQKNEKIFQCDITNKKSIKSIIQNIKPQYIINLAAISFVGTSNKELFYKVNVLAVENILDSIMEMKNYRPKKVILVSSATVYGNQNNNLLDEAMSPNPINHYGISKYAMEQLSKTYFDKINLIVTRPFNYTGVGQEEHFLIPKIVSHYKYRKKVIELGNIDVYREFNDIGYVCEVYKQLLLSEVKSEIVNVSSNRLISLTDVISIMNKIADYKINIEVNPAFIRENEIISLSGSRKKLEILIGKIKQKDFNETLKEMYND